jgi:hypothetical protein
VTAPLPVALWLLPASPWREKFGAIIRDLAAIHRSVAFEPHITLHVGALHGAAPTSNWLGALGGARAPITLSCGATAHGPEHFKTLFVAFDDTTVTRLRDALLASADLRGDYPLQPHLSLLYRGGLDEAERARLAAQYRFDGERVTFDEVVLVRPGRAGADLLDIATLDTTERVRLAGHV